MANKQTRRTVSFNRQLYEAIRERAAARGISASQWLTEIAIQRLHSEGRDFKLRLTFASPKSQAGAP